MPGLGRMSTPVPKPVLVTSWRTGKFFGDVGQRPAARLAARAALGADDRQVVRIAVRVVAEQQADVELQRAAVAAAERSIAAVVQEPCRALQQAGVVGAVLDQQVRGRLEDVDRADQVVLAGAEQVDARTSRSPMVLSSKLSSCGRMIRRPWCWWCWRRRGWSGCRCGRGARCR